MEEWVCRLQSTTHLLAVFSLIPSSLATTATGHPVKMMQSAVSRLYSSVHFAEPIPDPFVHARDAIRFRHAAESHRYVSEISIQINEPGRVSGGGIVPLEFAQFGVAIPGSLSTNIRHTAGIAIPSKFRNAFILDVEQLAVTKYGGATFEEVMEKEGNDASKDGAIHTSFEEKKRGRPHRS